MIVQFVQANNRLLSSAQIVYHIDRARAQQVIQELMRVEAESGIRAKYLEVSGVWQMPPSPAVARVGVIGSSLFEWDGGSARRIAAFLSVNGYRFLDRAPLELRLSALQASLSMPTWPMQGSVKMVGEVAVVKFGPLSSRQKAIMHSLCRDYRERSNGAEGAIELCSSPP